MRKNMLAAPQSRPATSTDLAPGNRASLAQAVDPAYALAVARRGRLASAGGFLVGAQNLRGLRDRPRAAARTERQRR